jgi:hypothetical protein
MTCARSLASASLRDRAVGLRTILILVAIRTLAIMAGDRHWVIGRGLDNRLRRNLLQQRSSTIMEHAAG